VHAERDLVTTVVDVMGDPVAGGQRLGFTYDDCALRLPLAVVPLVNGKPPTHRSEHRPAVGVWVLRVLRPDRPEEHARV